MSMLRTCENCVGKLGWINREVLELAWPTVCICPDLQEKDSTLKDRTVLPVLPVKDIILLLEFCLQDIFLSFQDEIYKQVEGVAMGSPVTHYN